MPGRILLLFLLATLARAEIGFSAGAGADPHFHGVGYEAGAAITALRRGPLSLEAGLRAETFTDELSFLVSKATALGDVTWSEKNRLFYAGIPLALVLAKRDGLLRPYLAAGAELDLKVFESNLENGFTNCDGGGCAAGTTEYLPFLWRGVAAAGIGFPAFGRVLSLGLEARPDFSAFSRRAPYSGAEIDKRLFRIALELGFFL